MSRIITLYGQDGGGKTTLAYSLADRLASDNNLVLIVHTDLTKPVLSERMPELQNTISLGQLLMAGDYYNLEKTFIPYSLNENVFVTGIINNENYSSYNHCSPETAKEYYETVVKIFDYIIVDTTDDVDDTLAIAGLAQSGIVVELISPNIQGIVFQKSYDQIFDNLNTKGKTIFAAAKVQPYHDTVMIEKKIGVKFEIKLPYSNEVDAKSMSGSPIKGFFKKEGLAYEKNLKQLQKLVV